MMPLPLRKLSIRIASLSINDREWILSQLTESERYTITALLAEIDDLGLLKDPSIGYAILAEPMPTTHQFSATQKSILVHLTNTGHSVWAAFFLLGLEPISRKQLIEVMPTDNFSVVQWLEKLSSANVPPALLKAFHQLADPQGYGYGN